MFDREERIEVEFPDMRKEVLPDVVRFTRPAPGMSFILYSDLDETTVDAAIDNQIAYFAARELPFEWKVYAHDRPPDLRARLLERGFEPDEIEAVMVLDVARAPETLLAEPAADVRLLTSPAQLGDVVEVLAPVWNSDFNWVYERLGSHMAIPGYLSVYVAYVDGRPACAGWTYFHQGHFAGLWGGSTIEAYRGRGLYRAVLSARVREARARGVTYLTVDASDMSRPILARHGFEILTHAIGCRWAGRAGSL